jgi:hypothetical protein
MVAAADGPEGEQPDEPGTPPPPSTPDFANETTVLHPMGRPEGDPGFAPPSPAEQAQQTPAPFAPGPPPGSGYPPPGAPGGPPDLGKAPGYDAPPAYAQQPPVPPPGQPWGQTPPPGQPWGGPPAGGFPPAGGPPPPGGFPPAGGPPPPGGGFGAPPPGGPPFGGPPFGGPPTGPGPQPPEKRKKRGGLIFGIIATLVVLALIAGGAVVALGGDDDDDDDDVAAEDLGDVVLLAADDAGSAAFASGLTPAFGTLSDEGKAARPEGGTPYFGTLEGVHGGVFGESGCRRDEIAAALADDDERADAFAAQLGADDVDAALAELTPIVLLNDTRVTDYGFDDGEVVTRQAVLQEGTAVMVDDRGAPRVRCASGNPLGAPVIAEGGEEFTGDAWSTFVEDKLTTIDPGEDPVDEFVLTDIETGDRFVRPVASEGDEDTPVVVEETTTTTAEETTTTTAEETTTTTAEATTTTVLGTGDVQITLRWDGPADLDLYVTDPNGEQLSFGSTSTSSGGQLDVDANAACGTAAAAPTENVFWPAGGAPLGTYLAGVSLYDACGGGTPVAWTLTITVDGQVWVLSGSAATPQADVVADATIVRGEGGGVTPGFGVTVSSDPTAPTTTAAPGGPTTTTTG